MECERGTRQNPDGRRGTWAGWMAHYRAGEDPCDECNPVNGERVADWRDENPLTLEQVLENNLRKHGVDVEWFDRQHEAQGNVCGICGQPPEDGKRLEVDHDHSHCPGGFGCRVCVRGLLCHGCNGRLSRAERGEREFTEAQTVYLILYQIADIPPELQRWSAEGQAAREAARIEQALELFDAGLTQPRAAEMIGISTWTLGQDFRRAGRPSPWATPGRDSRGRFSS